MRCASYALEILSHCGGLRSHAFGALITDNTLELLYYDRLLPVQSEPVFFLENPAALVAFLYCMQQLNRWGRVIVMETTPPSPSSLVAFTPPPPRSAIEP